jgi:hypothetical protein
MLQMSMGYSQKTAGSLRMMLNFLHAPFSSEEKEASTARRKVF